MTIQGNITAKAGTLIALIARLRAELKANRRAALGLLIVGGIVGGYGLLGVDDSIDALRGRKVEATHRLERLTALGQEKEWADRAAASQQMRATLEARLWKAENEGIARADLQDWVTNEGREAGLDKVRVSVDATKANGLPSNYRVITATINALITEASLTSFLDRIQHESRLLIVDHLQARERPVPSMEMKLLAYVVLNDERPAAK